MGFWDAQLSDLEAIGITVDPLEERLLEEGGQVLHLRHLAHPESTPDNMQGFWDHNDEPVLVLERLETYAPNKVFTWHTEYAEPGDTTAQIMEYQWGDYWRRYPTYGALLQDEDRYAASGWASYQSWRSERLEPFRFWTCAPLLDEAVYDTIAAACQQRLLHSHYYDLEALASFGLDDDAWMDAGSLWLAKNDPGRLSESEMAYLQDWSKWSSQDQDSIDEILTTYERLVENEIIPPPWWSRKDGDIELKPIMPEPLETYLTDPLGLEIWHRMLARNKYVVNRLLASMTPGEQSQFKYSEGDFV